MEISLVVMQIHLEWFRACTLMRISFICSITLSQDKSQVVGLISHMCSQGRSRCLESKCGRNTEQCCND